MNCLVPAAIRGIVLASVRSIHHQVEMDRPMSAGEAYLAHTQARKGASQTNRRQTTARKATTQTTTTATGQVESTSEASTSMNQGRNTGRLECGICRDRDIDTVLLPCVHMLCRDCAYRLERCPVCRILIKQTLKSFPIAADSDSY